MTSVTRGYAIFLIELHSQGQRVKAALPQVMDVVGEFRERHL